MFDRASVAAAVLDASRWRADAAVTNHFGERVWLRRRDEGGIIECCDVEAPCHIHRALSSPPAGSVDDG